MTATISRTAPVTEPSVRPAPRREPPFDDEVSGAQLRVVGPWDRRLPFVDGRRAGAPTAASLLPCALPDPVAWGRRLLIGIIETAGGRRPLQQLAALLSPRVASGLGADFERAAALNTRHWTHAATVRSIHACVPADGVAELNATVQAGRRVRAVAFRLEAREGRWRCTKLQLG
jgi:hypothetical protein